MLGPLHTLKGNSGMMGFSSVKDYVHRLEDVFARIRDGALLLSPALFETLFAGASALRDAVEARGPRAARGPRPADRDPGPGGTPARRKPRPAGRRRAPRRPRSPKPPPWRPRPAGGAGASAGAQGGRPARGHPQQPRARGLRAARPPPEPGGRAHHLPHQAPGARAADGAAPGRAGERARARGRGRSTWPASPPSSRKPSWTSGCCPSGRSSTASRAWCATSRRARARRWS